MKEELKSVLFPWSGSEGEVYYHHSATMAEELKKFTKKEVETHKDKKSTWIVIHDNVYDVTEFLEEVFCQLKIFYISCVRVLIVIYNLAASWRGGSFTRTSREGCD